MRRAASRAQAGANRSAADRHVFATQPCALTREQGILSNKRCEPGLLCETIAQPLSQHNRGLNADSAGLSSFGGRRRAPRKLRCTVEQRRVAPLPRRVVYLGTRTQQPKGMLFCTHARARARTLAQSADRLYSARGDTFQISIRDGRALFRSP